MPHLIVFAVVVLSTWAGGGSFSHIFGSFYIVILLALVAGGVIAIRVTAWAGLGAYSWLIVVGLIGLSYILGATFRFWALDLPTYKLTEDVPIKIEILRNNGRVTGAFRILCHQLLLCQCRHHLFPRPLNGVGSGANRNGRRKLESLEMRHAVILSEPLNVCSGIQPSAKRASGYLISIFERVRVNRRGRVTFGGFRWRSGAIVTQAVVEPLPRRVSQIHLPCRRQQVC